jgi:hypothetical protein
MGAFDIRGYRDIGTFNSGLPHGVSDGHQLMADWYQLVREMGKRALKYKHLPHSLQDVEMLIHIFNVYYWLIANMTVLLNLNRLPQYNVGFSNLTRELPSYMARVSRLWRRTSALAMPPFLKAHAIRNGMIVYAPGVLAPTFRMWHPLLLLEEVDGGPTITSITGSTVTMLQDHAKLGTLVSNLESAERWLEVGTDDIIDDFAATKDLIDMTRDIVPGSFEPGLPKGEDMPGLVVSPSVMTDLLRRAVFRKDKVTAGTDRWIIFPVPETPAIGNRIPIAGLGAPSLYDYTFLGAPKYGIFDSGPEELADDVDSDVRITGTDYQVMVSWDNSPTIADIFGSDAVCDEQILTAPSGTHYSIAGAFDVNVAADLREYVLKDPIRVIHPWDRIRYCDREAWPIGWQRLLDETVYSYIMYQEAQDLGENYAEFIGKSLGIPYIGHPCTD